MKSCLYSCSVYHDRSRPARHVFNYRLFYFCIDLDDMDALFRHPLISRDKGNLYTLSVKDHLDFGASTIRENLIRYLRQEGVEGAFGRIRMLTSLRTMGYLFNPVSFYFIEDPEGRPFCAVAEVANTFNEQKLYVLRPETCQGDRFRDEQSKWFYISPFSDLDTQLIFNLTFPDEKLSLSINQSDGEGIYFKSGIRGQRRELNTRNLVLQTLRYPLVPFQVILAIHWQALKLFLKKIPVRGKAATQSLQKNTRLYLKPERRSPHFPVV